MESVVIMALVLFEVALWQWRMALTARDAVAGAMLLALVGAVVQITVITRVVTDMGDIPKVASYACGVAVGVLVGCVIDRRLSHAMVTVRVFAPADPALVPALRGDGWPVTATRGEGHKGPVEVLYVAIAERRLATFEKALHCLAPAASWTTERITKSRGLLPSPAPRASGDATDGSLQCLSGHGELAS